MGVEELVLISLILELLEVAFHYSSTLKGSIYRLYRYYNSSPFIFFATHFGYIWILYVSIVYSNLSWPILVAVTLKTFDIFTKLELIKKLFIEPDMKYISSVATLLDTKIPIWVYLVGPFTYPYLIYLAFS